MPVDIAKSVACNMASSHLHWGQLHKATECTNLCALAHSNSCKHHPQAQWQHSELLAQLHQSAFSRFVFFTCPRVVL